MYQVQDYLHAPLYVCTSMFNSPRYKSRWKHYQRFAAMVKAAGGVLVTVEASFGERHHALAEGEDQHGQLAYPYAPTKPTEFHKARSTNNHIYIPVQTSSEIWIKENLLNIAIAHISCSIIRWCRCGRRRSTSHPTMRHCRASPRASSPPT
jgi:hypothetical protein